MRTRLAAPLVLVGLSMTLLAACGNGGGSAAASSDRPTTLKLGVPPSESDPDLLEKVQPVADAIEAATGAQVEVTETSDYNSIVEAMRSNLLDLALFSPMPTVIAQDVANVQPLVAAEGAPYRSVIICRPDAHVTSLAQVADHSIAFVDPGSTSGNYIPRLMLKQAGVDVDNLDETFAGGHDTAVLSVKEGSTDCAATATIGLEQMVEADVIETSDYEEVAESDTIPISSVVIARDGLSSEMTTQITDELLDDQTLALLEMAAATKLVAAQDADWSMFRDAATELGIKLEDIE